MHNDFGLFGKLVQRWIDGKSGSIFNYSRDFKKVLEFSEQSGLIWRVNYDPIKHGNIDAIAPGDKIWYWGNKGSGLRWKK